LNAFGSKNTATFKVAATDAYGNIGNAIGNSVAVGLSTSSPNSAVSPSTTIPGAGPAISTSTTYTSPNGSSWTTDSLKATAAGFTDATATINR
jgi:hypothetical protein